MNVVFLESKKSLRRQKRSSSRYLVICVQRETGKSQRVVQANLCCCDVVAVSIVKNWRFVPVG